MPQATMFDGFQDYSMQLAARIASARREADISQRKLGALVGVSGQWISKMELGGVRVDSYILLLLAKALGVNPGWLLDPQSNEAGDGGTRCATCENAGGALSGVGNTLPRVTVGKQVRKVPLYVEVAENLRAEVANGVFKGGQMLPSARTLGNRFGTSSLTVIGGIRLLVEAGIVFTVQGKGVFVEKGGATKAKQIAYDADFVAERRRDQPGDQDC